MAASCCSCCTHSETRRRWVLAVFSKIDVGVLFKLFRVEHSEMDHCRSRKKGIYMTSDNFGDNMFFRRGLQLGAMRLRLATNSM